MATDVGKIKAEIELELSKLKSQLTEMKNSIVNMSKSINSDTQKQTKQFSGAWQAGFAIISLYGVKAAHAIKQAFAQTIGTFANFEQSLANTQSVAQATEEEFAALEEAARRVGATTRSTAADAADALYYLASAGFSAKESIAALEGVNALAIATNSDLARTSETVATTIRQYGLETSAATDIANTFTAAITNSLATMDKLTKSFEYVGPIAAGLGLSVEQTTAALQLLYNKGFSGEKAGRGLRTILVNLADSTSIVNKRLARLGITFDEINPATNDLGDIFDTLREKGVDATNAAAIFGKVSGAQLQALISTASDAKGGIVELEEAVTGTNRAFEAMDIQMDTLQGSFDQFKNATEALEIQTGKGLEPILRLVVDTATDIVRALGELSPATLALGASLATLTGISLTLAVAIKGVAAAAFGAQLAIAPIAGIIAGIGIAVVGLAAGMKKLDQMKLDALDEQFGGLAQETNVAEEGLRDFYDAADQLTKSVKMIPPSVLQDADKFARLIKNWAESYGITEEQALKLFKQNENLVAIAGDSVALLEEEISAEKALAEKRPAVAAERQANAQAYYNQLQAQKDLEKALSAEEEKRSETIAEAQAGLQLAFERAVSYQRLLGDEYNRNTELANAYKNSIQNLIEQGLSYEDVEVQNLIKLYEQLQEQYGKVNKDGLSDTEKRQKVQADIAERLKEIVEEEKLAVLAGQEYNAQKERQAAVLSGINELIDEGFTIEGRGIQAILSEYGIYISNLETVNTLADEYAEKIADLRRAEIERLDVERIAAIERANGNEIAIHQINEYYGLLQQAIALEEREERIAKVKEYTDKLDELKSTEVERLELQRQTALAAVEGFGEAEDAVNAYYDALIDEAKFREFQDKFSTIAGLVQDAFSTINDAIQLSFEKQIEAVEETLNAQLEAIDERLQAELEASGLAEETELERLQRELAEAILVGDAATIAEAQDALDRYNITKKYDDEKAAAEEEAARKTAELEYKAALADWTFRLLGAIGNTAAGVVQALPNIPLSIAVGAIGAAQTAIVAANKPQKPKFADGGIVPGSATTGDVTPILANAGELILNKAQQNTIAESLGSNNDGRPIIINHSTYLDGKIVAQNSATYYNNGRVKLKVG